MARLRNVATGTAYYLDHESMLGRARSSTLCCELPCVSLHHAALRWTASGRWEIEDLNSRNGTFVNGQRLLPGCITPLKPGATVALGTLDNRFEFDDASRPTVMLVPMGGGEPLWPLAEQILALPDAETATHTLFSHPSGQWLLESPSETRPLQHGDIVVVKDTRWRFSCPQSVDPTATVPHAGGLGRVRDLHATLRVSADEETVQLALTGEGHTEELGSKACYYLLLVLARCRLQQGGQRSVRADGQGWVEIDALGEKLRMTEQRLNVDIFRVRRLCAEVGVLDANNVIERRGQPRGVRFGVERVTIVSL